MEDWKVVANFSFQNLNGESKVKRTMTEVMIKNMVCPRCVMAVENSLKDLGIAFEKVLLGKVLLPDPVLSQEQLRVWESKLNDMGFQILKEKDAQRIEAVKNHLQALLLGEEIPISLNLSGFLKEKMVEDYSRLSHLFSSMEGVTIEKYFIHLKIEKVKELLFYQELQLSEMAWKLGYSSVQHLSAQFKKVTGMTPSAYKKLKEKPRNGMDKI